MRWEEARRSKRRTIGMGNYFSVQVVFAAGLEWKGTEKVVRCKGGLFRWHFIPKLDEKADHIFCHVIVGSKLSVEYLNVAVNKQNILESLERKISSSMKAFSRGNSFQVQQYFHEFFLGNSKGKQLSCTTNQL